MPPQQNESQLNAISYNASSTANRLVSKGGNDNLLREIGSCAVSAVGLENFINAIVKEIDLNLKEDVEFNLNDRGVLFKWKDVYEVEATYAKCLGIRKRLYNVNAFTHEPSNNLAFFVLEEFNHRTYSFLPQFNFHVLVFCYYDPHSRFVTKVSVQYDQHSFFLHCLGVERIWRWTIANLLTPPARLWAKAYVKSGMVNPFTFVAQIVLFVWGISKLCALA
jgi:hypothetical protein